MKRQIAVCITCAALILAIALVGCGTDASPEHTDKTAGSSYAADSYELQVSTGKAEGHLSHFLLYANGGLYAEVKTYGAVVELPDGYHLAGEVTKTDAYHVPDEAFTATHLKTGSEVYADPDDPSYVYVSGDIGGGYYRYKRCDDIDMVQIAEDEKTANAEQESMGLSGADA